MFKLAKYILTAILSMVLMMTVVSAKEVEHRFSAIYLPVFSAEDFEEQRLKKYCESEKTIRIEYCFIDNGDEESVFDPKLGAGVPERGIFDKENARLLYDDEYLNNYLNKFDIKDFTKQAFLASSWFDGYMLYIMTYDKEYVILLPSKHQSIGGAKDRTPYEVDEILDLVYDREYSVEVNGVQIEKPHEFRQRFLRTYIPLFKVLEGAGFSVKKDGDRVVVNDIYRFGWDGKLRKIVEDEVSISVENLAEDYSYFSTLRGIYYEGEIYITSSDIGIMREILPCKVIYMYDYENDICKIEFKELKEDYKINVNGELIETDDGCVPAKIAYPAYNIPLRKVFEALGYEVGWDGEQKKITVGDYEFTVEYQWKKKDGEGYDVSFSISHKYGELIERERFFGDFINDTFYADTRSFKMLDYAMGIESRYDEEDNTIYITSNEDKGTVREH